MMPSYGTSDFSGGSHKRVREDNSNPHAKVPRPMNTTSDLDPYTLARMQAKNFVKSITTKMNATGMGGAAVTSDDLRLLTAHLDNIISKAEMVEQIEPRHSGALSKNVHNTPNHSLGNINDPRLKSKGYAVLNGSIESNSCRIGDTGIASGSTISQQLNHISSNRSNAGRSRIAGEDVHGLGIKSHPPYEAMSLRSSPTSHVNSQLSSEPSLTNWHMSALSDHRSSQDYPAVSWAGFPGSFQAYHQRSEVQQKKAPSQNTSTKKYPDWINDMILEMTSKLSSDNKHDQQLAMAVLKHIGEYQKEERDSIQGSAPSSNAPASERRMAHATGFNPYNSTSATLPSMPRYSQLPQSLRSRDHRDVSEGKTASMPTEKELVALEALTDMLKPQGGSLRP